MLQCSDRQKRIPGIQYSNVIGSLHIYATANPRVSHSQPSKCNRECGQMHGQSRQCSVMMIGFLQRGANTKPGWQETVELAWGRLKMQVCRPINDTHPRTDPPIHGMMIYDPQMPCYILQSVFNGRRHVGEASGHC